MYGYVKVDKNSTIQKISCKKIISKLPWNDHAIIGHLLLKEPKFFKIY